MSTTHDFELLCREMATRSHEANIATLRDLAYENLYMAVELTGACQFDEAREAVEEAQAAYQKLENEDGAAVIEAAIDRFDFPLPFFADVNAFYVCVRAREREIACVRAFVRVFVYVFRWLWHVPLIRDFPMQRPATHHYRVDQHAHTDSVACLTPVSVNTREEQHFYHKLLAEFRVVFATGDKEMRARHYFAASQEYQTLVQSADEFLQGFPESNAGNKLVAYMHARCVRECVCVCMPVCMLTCCVHAYQAGNGSVEPRE